MYLRGSYISEQKRYIFEVGQRMERTTQMLIIGLSTQKWFFFREPPSPHAPQNSVAWLFCARRLCCTIYDEHLTKSLSRCHNFTTVQKLRVSCGQSRYRALVEKMLDLRLPLHVSIRCWKYRHFTSIRFYIRAVQNFAFEVIYISK